MIDPEEIFKQMNQQHQRNKPSLNVPIEKIDLFIQRCLDDKDYSLYSLGQDIVYKLERCWHSEAEAEILPKVFKRIQEKIDRGEK